MTAPTALLLARLANILEAARLEAGADGGNPVPHIKRAQELLEVIRDA